VKDIEIADSLVCLLFESNSKGLLQAIHFAVTQSKPPQVPENAHVGKLHAHHHTCMVC
jgi:hypothetical protein